MVLKIVNTVASVFCNKKAKKNRKISKFDQFLSSDHRSKFLNIFCLF